ncbi:hypothetical protein Hanom_Chr11g01030011 [Helianthus anomalus]
MTRYTLSESKVSIPTMKKGGFLISKWLIMRYFDLFIIIFLLSCGYFDTYKRSPKEFFLYLFHICLL